MSKTTPTTAAPAPTPTHAPSTRLREYETIFLVHPDLAEDQVDKLVERMRGIAHREGGKVLKISNWGKKKTAYEVKKHLRAIYIHVLYLGDSKIVSELERNLRMTDDVMKYQSVKVADDVDASARQVEADVKLPGDPEMPAHPGREEPAGYGDSFRERDRDLGEDAEIPPEVE